MRRCGEQTNELHISRRERKGKTRGRGGRVEGGGMEQEGQDDDRDREMRGGGQGEEAGGEERRNSGGRWGDGEALHLRKVWEKERREKRGRETARRKRGWKDKE